MIQPEPKGSTQGYPLVSVEVLRYDKRSKSENIGIVPTEMELILEHTQQEHPSDTQVFTMKMEILLEPTSNKLMVTPTKPRQMTKPYSSHRFIANCFNVGKLKIEVKIMSPTMTTRSVGRPAAASRGGEIGGQVDRGGQGSKVNGGVGGVPDFSTIIAQQLQNLLFTIIRGMVAATEPKIIQKAVQLASTLTDEALRNGSIKMNHEKIGNGGESSKNRNGRDDNKRTRTENAFATTANPARGGYTGMDWLSDHKSEIICHEKVVKIPLLDGKFRIELIPRATPVVKSPYRLAPSELEKLSGQLKELYDQGFIRPSTSP
uniref:Putative reverse transcriptase domain-containing protein n=1 Tax=Tanacetum cinerariifolium TaxID=118510 RepID=A0A699ILY2_TANCI|nr:putative reverse transcriptase domain-containing protein [Tanacetum cinerariifolium]